MKDLRRGMVATLPLAPGIVAFGLLYGMMARQAGLSPWQAAAMSMIVHAGSSQIAPRQSDGAIRRTSGRRHALGTGAAWPSRTAGAGNPGAGWRAGRTCAGWLARW